MRRGCISLGHVQCDDCHRIIDYLEPYLVTDETEGKILHLCFDCALNMGFVHYRQEKGDRVVTFFPE